LQFEAGPDGAESPDGSEASTGPDVARSTDASPFELDDEAQPHEAPHPIARRRRTLLIALRIAPS
jgi:hypothetical protein